MSNFDVMAVIKANVSNFKSGLKEAEGSLTSFRQVASSTFENIGGTLSGFGTALTVGITTPLVAAGATAFNFAADMEDAMGATDQIFGSASKEVKSWANDLESYYGIAESQALEYGNTMGSMLKNIGGLSEKEAAETTGTLIELAGDLTAMYGGTTESAVQALTGALKGNNSMLDNYGMGVNEATIKAKALEMGLSDGTSELTLQAKQAATLALIMEQTADAQGQAGREAEGASGGMRALMTELKNLSTELGSVLLPIITPFIQKLKDMVARFREMTPEQQENIVKWAMIAAAVGPVLIVIGKLIAFIPKLMEGFDALKLGMTKLAPVFTFLTSPIGLLIVAITAIVGVIVYLWNTNEGFRSAVIAAWEAVKTKASEMWTAVTGFFSEMATNISEKAKQIWESVKTAFTDMVTAATEKGTEIVESVKTAFNNAVTAAKEFVSDAVQAGIDLIMGFANGVKQAAGNLITSVTEAVGGAIDKAKSLLGIKSPSRVFMEIGDFTMQGFAEGIGKNANQPLRAMQELTKGIRDTWSNDVGRLQANVGGSIKRDIQTSVNIQSNGLNNMFAEFLAQRQYLVLDTGAFVGHTQSAYDKANGTAINLGKRIKR